MEALKELKEHLFNTHGDDIRNYICKLVTPEQYLAVQRDLLESGVAPSAMFHLTASKLFDSFDKYALADVLLTFKDAIKVVTTIPVAPTPVSNTPIAATKKRKAIIICGQCGHEGHNKRTCKEAPAPTNAVARVIDLSESSDSDDEEPVNKKQALSPIAVDAPTNTPMPSTPVPSTPGSHDVTDDEEDEVAATVTDTATQVYQFTGPTFVQSQVY